MAGKKSESTLTQKVNTLIDKLLRDPKVSRIKLDAILDKPEYDKILQEDNIVISTPETVAVGENLVKALQQDLLDLEEEVASDVALDKAAKELAAAQEKFEEASKAAGRGESVEETPAPEAPATGGAQANATANAQTASGANEKTATKAGANATGGSSSANASATASVTIDTEDLLKRLRILKRENQDVKNYLVFLGLSTNKDIKVEDLEKLSLEKLKGLEKVLNEVEAELLIIRKNHGIDTPEAKEAVQAAGEAIVAALQAPIIAAKAQETEAAKETGGAGGPAPSMPSEAIASAHAPSGEAATAAPAATANPSANITSPITGGHPNNLPSIREELTSFTALSHTHSFIFDKVLDKALGLGKEGYIGKRVTRSGIYQAFNLNNIGLVKGVKGWLSNTVQGLTETSGNKEANIGARALARIARVPAKAVASGVNILTTNPIDTVKGLTKVYAGVGDYTLNAAIKTGAVVLTAGLHKGARKAFKKEVVDFGAAYSGQAVDFALLAAAGSYGPVVTLPDFVPGVEALDLDPEQEGVQFKVKLPASYAMDIGLAGLDAAGDGVSYLNTEIEDLTGVNVGNAIGGAIGDGAGYLNTQVENVTGVNVGETATNTFDAAVNSLESMTGIDTPLGGDTGGGSGGDTSNTGGTGGGSDDTSAGGTDNDNADQDITEAESAPTQNLTPVEEADAAVTEQESVVEEREAEAEAARAMAASIAPSIDADIPNSDEYNAAQAAAAQTEADLLEAQNELEARQEAAEQARLDNVEVGEPAHNEAAARDSAPQQPVSEQQFLAEQLADQKVEQLEEVNVNELPQGVTLRADGVLVMPDSMSFNEAFEAARSISGEGAAFELNDCDYSAWERGENQEFENMMAANPDWSCPDNEVAAPAPVGTGGTAAYSAPEGQPEESDAGTAETSSAVEMQLSSIVSDDCLTQTDTLTTPLSNFLNDQGEIDWDRLESFKEAVAAQYDGVSAENVTVEVNPNGEGNITFTFERDIDYTTDLNNMRSVAPGEFSLTEEQIGGSLTGDAIEARVVGMGPQAITLYEVESDVTRTADGVAGIDQEETYIFNGGDRNVDQHPTETFTDAQGNQVVRGVTEFNLRSSSMDVDVEIDTDSNPKTPDEVLQESLRTSDVTITTEEATAADGTKTLSNQVNIEMRGGEELPIRGMDGEITYLRSIDDISITNIEQYDADGNFIEGSKDTEVSINLGQISANDITRLEALDISLSDDGNGGYIGTFSADRMDPALANNALGQVLTGQGTMYADDGELRFRADTVPMLGGLFGLVDTVGGDVVTSEPYYVDQYGFAYDYNEATGEFELELTAEQEQWLADQERDKNYFLVGVAMAHHIGAGADNFLELSDDRQLTVLQERLGCSPEQAEEMLPAVRNLYLPGTLSVENMDHIDNQPGPGDYTHGELTAEIDEDIRRMQAIYGFGEFVVEGTGLALLFATTGPATTAIITTFVDTITPGGGRFIDGGGGLETREEVVTTPGETTPNWVAGFTTAQALSFFAGWLGEQNSSVDHYIVDSETGELIEIDGPGPINTIDVDLNVDEREELDSRVESAREMSPDDVERLTINEVRILERSETSSTAECLCTNANGEQQTLLMLRDVDGNVSYYLEDVRLEVETPTGPTDLSGPVDQDITDDSVPTISREIGGERFDIPDTNRDGSLSADEVVAGVLAAREADADDGISQGN